MTGAVEIGVAGAHLSLITNPDAITGIIEKAARAAT